MQKLRLVAIFAAAAFAPTATASELATLEPEQVTLENGDTAIRCATLSQLAKSAGFFADVPNGEVMVTRLGDRMLDIARDATPEVTDDELLAGMRAAFADYNKLTVNGDTSKKGEMMKTDFQICLERAEDLFGTDLLPDG